MSKFVQFVDGEIEFGLQIFDPGPQSVARMPQNFCFSGLLLANHATQWVPLTAERLSFSKIGMPKLTKLNFVIEFSRS
jgi:hypothetical protein